MLFCEVAGLGNPPNEEVLQDSKQRMLEMLETHGAAKNLTVEKLLRDWTNSHCHEVSFLAELLPWCHLETLIALIPECVAAERRVPVHKLGPGG